MDKWLNLKNNEKSNANKQLSSNTNEEDVTRPETIPSSSKASSKLHGGKPKIRKYDEAFISYGFTWTGDKNEPSGLCVECEIFLSNSSLNPTKLK